jgi:hypothetical protein
MIRHPVRELPDRLTICLSLPREDRDLIRSGSAALEIFTSLGGMVSGDAEPLEPRRPDSGQQQLQFDVAGAFFRSRLRQSVTTDEQQCHRLFAGLSHDEQPWQADRDCDSYDEYGPSKNREAATASGSSRF